MDGGDVEDGVGLAFIITRKAACFEDKAIEEGETCA
jgi:hypothetical protein